MFVSGQSSTRFVIVLIIIIFLNSPAAALTQYSDPPPILVTKLVHYLTLDSPFYDDYFSNKSARDISLFDLHTNIAQMPFETRLTARPTGGFLVHIKVGSKSFDQFVYMDTGSGLLWINCEPCGHNVPYPIFYPPDSTTFRKENCSLGFCPATGSVKVECKDKGTCTYTARYAGDDFSTGYLARDSITFQGSDEILQQVTFGCARATSGLKVNGMLGLSNNPISLISQMHVSKFGYCIGNISDYKYLYHMLTIGDEIELLGLSQNSPPGRVPATAARLPSQSFRSTD
ncbi:hypothetical protein CASFOL_041077 [Castilleja foliolosa]|uniref:Peptidase A1 domain-containing protein n=1 Tax=Castilleja foliolosa TaxID=1961234 RepID=A0ABD3BED0_9LAMI